MIEVQLSQADQARHQGRDQPQPLLSALAARSTRVHDLFAVPTPGRNEERSSPAKRVCCNKSGHAALTPQGPAVTSVRLDAIPAPRNIDKTTPPSGDGQYGDTPSKYGPTRYAYDPTHYELRSMTEVMTKRPPKPVEATTPELGIVAPTPQADQEATNSYTTPPRDQKAMTKAIAETTSHRMASEPPPCLQCRHGRHSSTTPHLTATWAQDHDDNHTQTCSIRRRSLQAKLARPLP
jgi:hypothetical protein